MKAPIACGSGPSIVSRIRSRRPSSSRASSGHAAEPRQEAQGLVEFRLDPGLPFGAAGLRALARAPSGFSLRQISFSTRLMTVVFWRMSRLTERKPKVSTSQRTGRTSVEASETDCICASASSAASSSAISSAVSWRKPVPLRSRREGRGEPHPEGGEELAERLMRVARCRSLGRIARQLHLPRQRGRGRRAGRQSPAS